MNTVVNAVLYHTVTYSHSNEVLEFM